MLSENAHHNRLDETRRFQTISVMVNTTCGLSCLHCDLPRRYSDSLEHLSSHGWGSMLERLVPAIHPEVISVAAMEPLLPGESCQKTRGILEKARELGISSGIVTNGIGAGDFFRSLNGSVTLDYLDISVEGSSEIDAMIRGKKHFPMVDDFLRTKAYAGIVDRIYISTTLNKWNSQESALNDLFGWIRRRLDVPRLVLLPLYPNAHVDTRLFLSDSDFLGTLDFLVRESRHFEDIFLEVFPSSLPGLATMIEDGYLPGADEVLRDEAGMLWGHIAENLYVRYENKHDLELSHLRVSPEGWVMPPESIERPDYLHGTFGNLVMDDWSQIEEGILRSVRLRDSAAPEECRERPCFAICRGENNRCPLVSLRSDK